MDLLVLSAVQLIAGCCLGKSLLLEWVGPMLLCDEEVGRIPMSIPGVYLLHTVSSRCAGYPVLYAGQSADLRCRLAQHLRTISTSVDIVIARGRLPMYFSAAPVFDVNLRAGVEAGLVVGLRPPFNRQLPRAVAVTTNLPPFAVDLTKEEIQ